MSTRASNIVAYVFLAQLLLACGAETESVNDRVELTDDLVINIDREGLIYVVITATGERLDEEASRTFVETRISENPSTKVVVQPDPQAPTEALVRALDWLNRIGAASPGAPEIREL